MNLWINGPVFLKLESSHWPISDVDNEVEIESCIVNVVDKNDSHINDLNDLFKITRYSSLFML